MILGLLHSESAGIERLTNFRRSVLYNYPNGSAPLIAILAMLKEEMTNDAQYYIYEKRLPEQRTITAQANAAGPFTNTANADSTAAGFSPSANDALRIHVVDATPFRIGHQVQVTNVLNGAASAYLTLKAVVTAVGTGYLDTRLQEGYTSISNDTDANGIEVLVIGNVASEAQNGAALAPYQTPLSIYNYTQIFRTPFQFSGSVLKMGLKYDKTGPYKDKAKDATIQHAIEMEKAIIYGVRQLYTDATTGLPTRTTGGIEWYLRQWEAGTAYGNTAATLDSDDNKRIITNSSGQMSLNTYEDYLERVFRVTSNMAQEKLVLCGSGFLKTINRMYVSKVQFTTDTVFKEKFGWDIVSHVTPFGTVHYKTHPLFSQNATMRYSALFLDVWHLVYRFLDGRDTILSKMQQEKREDLREDEWRTEAGLELRYPEAHMLMKNVREVIP